VCRVNTGFFGEDEDFRECGDGGDEVYTREGGWLCRQGYLAAVRYVRNKLKVIVS
jgi:hypothetical protein